MELNVGLCQHLVLEPIKNYGNAIIAYRCSKCTLIVSHVGTCEGCLVKHVRLTVFKSKRRYCDEKCLERGEKRRRQQIALKRKGG